MDPIIWIINADLLPDIGVGICSTINWISCIIVIVSFPYMLDSILQLQGIFLIYTILTLFVVIFMFFVFKETKNKTEIEIESLYEKWGN